ncbi:Uncharacterised protein [Legionella pneumophila]|nr:Uncharacterised protein [Legionella pneumophila]
MFCHKIRTVFRLKSMYRGSMAKLSFINTTSAVSKAVSVPLPIAKLIVAFAKAGASLMPSPTMPTA